MENLEEINVVDPKNVELEIVEKPETVKGNPQENITSEDYMEKNKKCTYFLLGELPVKQNMYICGRCDFYEPSPMCESCYNSCHTECYKTENKLIINNINNNSRLKPQSKFQRSKNVKLTKQKVTFANSQTKSEQSSSLQIDPKKQANKGMQVFSCLCGKIHKHRRIEARVDEKKEGMGKKCNLEVEMLASLFPAKKRFFCEDCKIQICSLCMEGCHYFHKVIEDPSHSTCKCNNSNHSMNDFLFNIYFNYKSTPVSYSALESSQKKILNMMFINKDLFGNIINLLKENLFFGSSVFTQNENKIRLKMNSSKNISNIENNLKNTNLIGSKLDENTKKMFDVLGIFFNVFYDRNDKCYFYNDELKSLFSYENCFGIIESLCGMEYDFDLSPLLLNFVGIFFYLHLKSDFQLTKNFSISDFMGSNIISRLKYHKQISQYLNDIKNPNPPTNTYSLLDKNSPVEENQKFEDLINLINLTLKLSKVLKNYLSKQNILSDPTLYEVSLRFINFVIKKMCFNKMQLAKLIDDLYEFFQEFFIKLIESKKDHEMASNLETTKFIFYYLIKICYMIAIIYNDITTNELIQEYKTTNTLIIEQKRKAYIHSNKQCGDKLLKMILKSVFFISESYSYNIEIDRKIINICNESLKIFSVTENFYFNQLNMLNEEEAIKVLGIHTETNENTLQQEIQSLSTRLIKKIESIFLEDNSKIINGEMKVYLTVDVIFRELINSKIDPFLASNKDLLRLLRLSQYTKKTIDNDNENNISSYNKKIMYFCSVVLGNPSKEKFYSDFSGLLFSDYFMINLISSNLDEIISKYFNLFDYKSLEEKDIDAAFSIYLLYCLNKRGLEHLCTGKNLAIITQLFCNESCRLLLNDDKKMKFLYLLFKGINLYNIDLSNHKCIFNLTKISEERLTAFNKTSFKQKHRLLKIYMYSKNFFEYEEFQKLQLDIFYKFIKFSDKSSFKKYMDEEFSNQLGETKKVIDKDSEIQAKESNELETVISRKSLEESVINQWDDNFKTNFKNEFSSKGYTDYLSEGKTFFNPSIKTAALKFYFSFFNFLTINTYYIFTDIPEQIQQLEEIHKFVDLDYMKKILETYSIPLNQRTNLLVFLRTFYFIDLLDSKSKVFTMNYLTNEEMQKLKSEENLNKNERERIEKKRELMFKIIAVMDIFVSELGLFTEMLKNRQFLPSLVREYLIQIVYSIKIISDFVYYSKSILENVNWYLYKIGKRFVSKSNVIKSILLNIRKYGHIGDILDDLPIELNQMEQPNFNFFNKDIIYNLISNCLIDILKGTNVDKNFKLEKYLRDHDRKKKNDFTPVGVIRREGYDDLYESKENLNTLPTFQQKFSVCGTEDDDDYYYKNINNKNDEKVSNNLGKLIRNIFKKPFEKIYNTCLLRVINNLNTKDELVDYRKNLVNYFINYIASDQENIIFSVKISNKIYTEKTLITLFNIIVKLLFYDPKNTQSVLESLNSSYNPPGDNVDVAPEKPNDLCKQFFKSLWNKIGKIFILNFSTSINFFMFDRYTEISGLNNLMVHFLQLLAEGFNSKFKSKIFELQITTTKSISIFNLIVTQFQTAFNLMDLSSQIVNNNELSHYKLIVLFSCMVDFFSEYADGTENPKDSKKVKNMIKFLFEKEMHKCLLIRIDTDYPNITKSKIDLVKKLLLRVKIKILDLLINFIQNEVKESFLKIIIKELPMIRLFEEIQYNLLDLLEKIQRSAIKNNLDKSFHDILGVYNYNNREFVYSLTRLILTNDEFTNSLEMNLCIKIFIYLSMLSDLHGIHTIDDHFSLIKFNKIKYLKKLSLTQGTLNNSNISFLSPNAIKVYKFMKNIVKKVEVKNLEEKKIYKTFFFRPPVTFHLSKPTQRQFLDLVDRESRFSKLSSLIKQTDYFMFEMVYYSHFKTAGIKINNLLDLYYLEMFNYILIIIHQIILLVNYYISTKLPESDYFITDEDKYKIRSNNLTLSFIQIFYILLIIILWFFFQFPLKLFNNLMTGDKTFLFNKEGEEKREIINKFNESKNIEGILSHLNFVFNVYKNNTFWKILGTTIWDCLIMNRSINIFFFTLIFTILYLCTGSALFLVFPVLFIINIIPILYGMFVALKTKFSQLLTMLIFTYLCVYFYMWISFYFIYPIFEFDNIYIKGEGISNTERLCSSAIECYLTMMDLGFRSGGGIGDVLPYASWKNGTSFYIIHFFYKLTFYIFIILILSNSCFGIIIDAFSDLRDKTSAIDEDKKNICYICEISRDRSLNKNINFDMHVKKVHHVWDYVYFITHLLLNDSNNFNKTEFHVWQQISNSYNDIGWIPADNQDED